MDKNTKEQKKQKGNLFYLLTLLIILVLFVISAFINEIVGMLMFGILLVYAVLGKHSYKEEHKACEEILQYKRELLDYDRASAEQKKKEDVQSHIKKSHLLMIALMFVTMIFISYVSINLGMIIFGIMVFYILYVPD